MTAPTRRRGFATLTALGLIAVIGVGLAALAALLASEARRSERVRDGAQLRQLLLAGEPAARAALIGGERDGEVALPAELKAQGAALTFAIERAEGSDEARVRVTARLAEGRSMSQALTYVAVGAEWTLRAAELD